MLDAADAVKQITVALLSRLDRTLGREQRHELVARIAQVRAELKALVEGAPVPGPPCLDPGLGTYLTPPNPADGWYASD